LTEQNFDFNKVFYKGISYINKENEDKIRHRIKRIEEENKTPKGKLYPSNNKETKEQIDKLMYVSTPYLIKSF